MGHTEDDEGSVLDDVLQVGHGDQVSGQGDVGEVSRVLVRSVDDVGQLLAVDLWDVNPGLWILDVFLRLRLPLRPDLRAFA